MTSAVNLEEEVLTKYKIFCHDSSERILKDVTNCTGTIHEEAGTTVKDIDYGCFIKAHGSTFTIDFSIFFSSHLAMALVPKALPWEPTPTQDMAISLFDEYTNMMIATIKKSLEHVDFLNLETPKLSKIRGSEVTLLGSVTKYNKNEKKALMRDSWKINLEAGSVFNHLRTDVLDFTKFAKGNFDSYSEANMGGQVIMI